MFFLEYLQKICNMITVKFYLDKRATKNGAPAILKIALIFKLKTVYLPTGIKVLPENWNSLTQKVIRVSDKDTVNNYLSQRKHEIEDLIFSYINQNIVFQNVYEIRDRLLSDLNNEKTNDENLFVTFFRKSALRKISPKTQQVYLFTLKRMTDFDNKLSSKHFEDITKGYLIDFDNYLAKTSNSKNGRNVHLRNIRAVFNDAIDEGITMFYPFRNFKIRPVPTRKRSLTIDELHTLMTYPIEDYQRRYVDLFMLDLYLIGINMIDLCHAKSINNGRLEYIRAKTKRLYSIKVEPEAMDIIEKYKGKDFLLNILDDYKNYQDFLNRMNKNLKRIGKIELSPNGKKTIHPIFPDLSTYWARHTWATIASSIGISRDVIAHALGHGINTVTDIYIDFDQDKVDVANRLVIDYIWSNSSSGPSHLLQACC